MKGSTVMNGARKHYEKYEALAQEFKGADLPSYVPVSVERIKAALDGGDIHLNTIGLAMWDKAANSWYMCQPMHTLAQKVCPTCKRPLPEKQTPRPLWRDFFRRKDGKRAYYSLSDRVCLLKHVARFWMAGAEPPS